MPGIGFGFRGLFVEADDAPAVVNRHDAELAGCFLDRHLDAADRHISVTFGMRGEKRAVVHLVNVIARENQNQLRVVRTNDVEVLVDGVCSAPVPFATYAL